MPRPALLTFVALAAAVAPAAQERSVQPVYESRTDLVLLDMVVRDQRGRLVTDLRADEIQVFEEGSRRAIESFRWVGPETAKDASNIRSSFAAPGTQEPVAAPSLASIVVLAFDPLTPPAALAARKAAIAFLGRPFPGKTTIAIVKLGARLRLVHPFSEDAAAMRKAVEAATIGEILGEPSTDPEYDSLTDQAFGMQHRLAVARPSALNPVDAMQLTMQVAMLRYADLFRREVRGRESLHSLLALINALATVQGRKTVLFFAEGLNAPPEVQALFLSTLGQANRANVTFYAIDASGLDVDSPKKNVALALEGARNTSQALMGDPNPAATIAADPMEPIETVTDALRLDTQANWATWRRAPEACSSRVPTISGPASNEWLLSCGTSTSSLTRPWTRYPTGDSARSTSRSRDPESRSARAVDTTRSRRVRPWCCPTSCRWYKPWTDRSPRATSGIAQPRCASARPEPSERSWCSSRSRPPPPR